MESNSQLSPFKDVILADYLGKVLKEIIPREDGSLFYKKPYIKVVEYEMPLSMALRSGCILLSTGLLAQVYSEDELYGLIASEVTHLLFKH